VANEEYDEEHVKRLKKGVAEWNAWRDIGQHARLDGAKLSDARLEGAELWAANLSGADLCYAHLFRANLENADLSGANLLCADLRGADLSGANLSGAMNLNNVNLSRSANLMSANLSEANLEGANLERANLNNANLSNANLSKARLEDANLVKAHLQGANLRDAWLRGANLRGADLPGADLRALLILADLRDANLTGANLSTADLSLVNLNRANLKGADLSEAILDDANLDGANLDGVNLSFTRLSGTFFGNVDLTSVIGLETCNHHGPSTIDYQTLEKSKSKQLPLAFLRGVGLSDNFISLLNQANQHYSCFISYSTKDQEFADRLYADLQNEGVRCWFAPHDLRIGKKILDAIDAEIRLRDRVLLILSEHSINSDWVGDEVTAGFEEERKRGEEVLFPIRLDDTVMKTKEAWAAKLRARLIGDFQHWKDHKAYKQSFERVVRDLTKVT